MPLKCKKARAEYNRRYRARNKAKLREYDRLHSRADYAANIDRHRAYQRAWYAKNRKKRIAERLAYMKKYPLKVLAQARRCRKLPEPTRPTPHKCECCGAHRKRLTKNFALDHCHETGKFRGWLCGRCNRGLGLLGDNLAGLMKAVRYLRRAELL